MNEPCDRCKTSTDGIYRHEQYDPDKERWIDSLRNGFRKTTKVYETVHTARFSRLVYGDRTVKSNTFTDFHLCPSCWDGLTDYLFPRRPHER